MSAVKDCDLKPDGAGFRCRACNRWQNKRVSVNCPGASGPSRLRRAANFAKAAAKHELRGRPKADQATIDARLAICHACPFYRPGQEACGHKQCGCGVSSKQKYLNKLAWADQQCPDGRW